MNVTTYKPLMKSGQAYLSQFQQLETLSREHDDSEIDQYQSGSSTHDARNIGPLEGTFLGTFSEGKGAKVVGRYVDKNDGSLSVGLMEVNTNPSEPGTVSRDYRERGELLQVLESKYDPAAKSYSKGQFMVNRQTGAIALLESPL